MTRRIRVASLTHLRGTNHLEPPTWSEMTWRIRIVGVSSNRSSTESSNARRTHARRTTGDHLERVRATMRPPPPSEILALAATVDDEAQKLRQARASAKGKSASKASAADFDVNGVRPASAAGGVIIDNSVLGSTTAGGGDSDAAGAAAGAMAAAGDAAGGARLNAKRGPTLKLPPPPDCAQIAVSLEGATLGWPPRDGGGDAAAAADPTATDVNVAITRGMRVVVRGPNGAGKSTLAKALAGSLPLIAGEVRRGLYE